MDSKTVKQGTLCAITAYGFWGLLPLYFKWVQEASAFEILAHRVLWSVVLLTVVIAAQGRMKELLAVFKDIKLLRPLMISAALVSVNWVVFIWAVNDGQVLETSLGYYINPLVSVFLAMVVLKETLNRLQWIAIGIAASGVIFQLISYGQPPWISLVLAFTFAGYGLTRKQINVNPFVGLCVETLLLLPFALLYFLYLIVNDELVFGTLGLDLDLLLILSGFVTAFPLVLFAAAASRLSLTALGLFQYLAPSMSFLLAVLVFDEGFGLTEIITFVLIWTALAVFCFDGLVSSRRRKTAAVN